MPRKRISHEMHAQRKILSEESYSNREIAARLKLAQKTVSRSISNFKTTRNYAYLKPKDYHKSASKRMDKSIILSAKKSARKSAKAIQAALPKDVIILSQRKIQTRLFNVNSMSCEPAKKPKLSPQNIAGRLTFCKKVPGFNCGIMKTCCTQTRLKYRSFIYFVETYDKLSKKETVNSTLFPPWRILQKSWSEETFVQKEIVDCCSCLKSHQLMELFISRCLQRSYHQL